MQSRIQRALRLRSQKQVLLASYLLVLTPSCGFAQPARDRQACAAGEAWKIVGEPYSPALAEKARRTAGAREVRKIEMGGAYTTDLNPDRLNVEVDRAGTVIGFRCG